MPWSFWAAYAIKLAILAAVFAGLYATARALRSSRLFARRSTRYVDVVESTMLSAQTAVHLLRVGNCYLLIGGGNGGLSKLAEFDQSEFEKGKRAEALS